jgi:hypothetical protein
MKAENPPAVLFRWAELFVGRSVPAHIRSDNGPEFAVKAVRHSFVATGTITLCLCSTFAVTAAFGQSVEQLEKNRIASQVGQQRIILVQLEPQLRPKPGYIIGRAVGFGKPVLALEMTVKGFPPGSFIEFVERYEPRVDPRTGYYEIRIKDGAYKVSARWNKRARDSFPATIECLLMLEDFHSTDGIPYAQQDYDESRRGIVKDFLWNPNPNDLERCSGATGF